MVLLVISCYIPQKSGGWNLLLGVFLYSLPWKISHTLSGTSQPSQPRQGNLKLAEMRKKKNLKGEEVEKSLGTAVIAVIGSCFFGG